MTYLGSGRLMEFGRNYIAPFRREAIQPASVDLTLSPNFAFVSSNAGNIAPFVVDTKQPVGDVFVKRTAESVTLEPHGFCLAATVESVRLPLGLLARVEGKSSLGRLGLNVHVTAGFIDPGFDGRITLELYNCAPYQIILHAGMPIAQLSVAEVVLASAYGGKYGGDEAPQISGYSKNWDGLKWK